MATPYKPRVVVAVHGIRTHAYWFRRLAELLGDQKICVRFFGYGYFSLIGLLLPWSRRTVVDQFCREYDTWINDKTLRLDRDHLARRPSVIAHSFGTYVVGECMRKYDYVKFDKVLLCGSILSRNFDWPTLFARKQVNLVRNEYSTRDLWTRIIGRAVRGTGPSGYSGFITTITTARRIEQASFQFYRHSNYFTKGHMSVHWLPFLQRRPLNFSILHGAEVGDGKYRRLLEQKIEHIDRPSYAVLPGYNTAGPPLDLLLQWIKRNSDIYTFLVDPEGDLMGYINAVPVRKSHFAKVKQGLANDNDISADDVIPYGTNQRLTVCLTSIAMTPSLRPVGQEVFGDAVDMLVNGYLAKLLKYAEGGVQVTHVAAVAWTQPGNNLCKRFGMKQTGYRNEFGHSVYVLDVKEGMPPKIFKRFPRLQDLLDRYDGNKKSQG